MPDLASTLNDLSIIQSTMGQQDAALTSAEQAVEAMWPLYVGLPQAFAQATATMIENLMTRHRELDKRPGPELLTRFVASTGVLAQTVKLDELALSTFV